MMEGERARVPMVRPGCGELRVDEERDTRVDGEMMMLVMVML